MRRKRIPREAGAAVVEMAFVTILLALLACGVADLGRAIFTNIGVHDAAQEGARYAAYEPRTVIDEQDVVERTIQATQYPQLLQADVAVCTTPTSVTVEVRKTVDYITPLIGSLLGGSIDLSHSYTSTFLNEDPLEAPC